MTKKILSLIILALLSLDIIAADERGKMSPESFQLQLETFIVKEACLTPQEASVFFPIYKEMNKKQRVIFDKMRRIAKTKPADETSCMNVIKQRDKLDLELKKIQQTYHNQFLNILPASKVFDVIKAEDKFHRRMLRTWSRKEKR